jgi:ATP-dependent Clp protease ATP-binding subunit ClpC
MEKSIVFERYSERARRLVFHARHQASLRGASEIEPSDLILGATCDAHQPGCPFQKLHDDAEKIRRLLQVPGATGIAAPDRDIPLSSAGKLALAYAIEEAERDNRWTIGSDHLVRGALRTKDGSIRRLKRAGYTLRLMRQFSHEAQRENPGRLLYEGGPFFVALQRLQWRWWRLTHFRLWFAKG